MRITSTTTAVALTSVVLAAGGLAAAAQASALDPAVTYGYSTFEPFIATPDLDGDVVHLAPGQLLDVSLLEGAEVTGAGLNPAGDSSWRAGTGTATVTWKSTGAFDVRVGT